MMASYAQERAASGDRERAGFGLNRLQVLAYAAGFTLWLYRLIDDELIEAAHRSRYFDDASDMLAVGDLVLLTGPDGAATRVVLKHDGHVMLKALA